jgi:hypothetical protein
MRTGEAFADKKNIEEITPVNASPHQVGLPCPGRDAMHTFLTVFKCMW